MIGEAKVAADVVTKVSTDLGQQAADLRAAVERFIETTRQDRRMSMVTRPGADDPPRGYRHPPIPDDGEGVALDHGRCWCSAMFASGVIAKQLGGGPIADMLMSLHKLTGALTLLVVVMRLIYRATRAMPEWKLQSHRRPVLHWTLYGVVVLVPLLGWAGISDFGAREIFPGYSLPPIWPEGAGYDGLLLQWHAYFAFALLALVALHIGVAIQDYMTDRHLDDN